MDLPLPIRILLWPLSWVYGVVVRIRAWLYTKGFFNRKRLRPLVISVGNLTVGGTGKTPMVLWLAEKFLADGKRVAILSRGYRGSGGTSDEIEVLKRRLGERVAFGVGPDRYAEGRRIESQQPVDVFLLDDGFQHLLLARDIDILMLDGSRELKKEWLLPAGILREPLSARNRADIVVVTRKQAPPDTSEKDFHTQFVFFAKARLLSFRRVGQTQMEPYTSELGAGPFFAFCGIGNPGGFIADLERWRLSLAGKMIFRDHHRYSAGDVRNLEEAAERAGAQALVTTEKDEQNLSSVAFRRPVYVAVIDFVLSSENEFCAVLERLLQERRGAAA
jgi:tetraacyldisaccharide 4'-kinase